MKCSEGMCEYIGNNSVAVTVKCKTGQFFSVYAYNKYATSIADACLNKGDFDAFCSPCVRESARFRIEEGCHHLEAHVGSTEQPNAKILFARKSHDTVSVPFCLCWCVFEGIIARW
jgi:hypothetical protein